MNQNLILTKNLIQQTSEVFLWRYESSTTVVCPTIVYTSDVKSQPYQ